MRRPIEGDPLDLDVRGAGSPYARQVFGRAVKLARDQGLLSDLDEPAIWTARRLIERLDVAFRTMASERSTADLARELREWLRELRLTPATRGGEDRDALDDLLAQLGRAPALGDTPPA